MDQAADNAPFEALATTSSVPFRVAMSGRELAEVFATGIVPERFLPHLDRALNEAPIEMIERVVARFGRDDGIVPRLRQIAVEVGASERIERWLSG